VSEARVEVREANLAQYCRNISRWIGYAFGDADWDAIECGLLGTSAERQQWYDYALFGDDIARLNVARIEGTSLVAVKVAVPEALVEDTIALASVLRYYDRGRPDLGLANLVIAEFADLPMPKRGRLLACTREHLSQCSECQETRLTFSGKRWTDFATSSWNVPTGYAHIAFLSKEAKRYFFPAYLLAAAYRRDWDALDDALHAVPSDTAGWSRLQNYIIEIVTMETQDAHPPE
jgi:hypothetical protein